jgi:hypothetical protein
VKGACFGNPSRLQYLDTRSVATGQCGGGVATGQHAAAPTRFSHSGELIDLISAVTKARPFNGS